MGFRLVMLEAYEVAGFRAGVSNFLGPKEDVRNYILPAWSCLPVFAQTAYTLVKSDENSLPGGL